MSIWTKEEVISLVALAVGIIAAIAGIFAVKDTWKRNILIVLLGVTLAACYAFTQRIRISGVASNLTQAEIELEARREVALEMQRRDAALIRARARAEREHRQQAEADSVARASVSREEVEGEARRAIARDRAIREARERIERETAERTAEVQRAVEGERLAHARTWIIGSWSLHDVQGRPAFPREIEFTPAGRLVRKSAVDLSYWFAKSDSVITQSWCCNFMFKVEAMSPDSFVFRDMGVTPLIARRIRR